eukprot:3038015-Rhodomonas_salina.1
MSRGTLPPCAARSPSTPSGYSRVVSFRCSAFNGWFTITPVDPCPRSLPPRSGRADRRRGKREGRSSRRRKREKRRRREKEGGGKRARRKERGPDRAVVVLEEEDNRAPKV